MVAVWIGVRDDAKTTYHFVEVLQQRGRWIFPDVGYIDFDHAGQYRELFIGGGAVLHKSKHLTVAQEAYLNQTSGPASGRATYLMLWTLVGYRLTSKLGGETVYLPYVPLNQAGRIQHVIERAKLEYGFKRFKVGGGYGAYQYGDGPWQNKPFITTTLKGSQLANLELWLQRMPEHHVQVQLRYVRVFN